jgi:hypothetical protein
MASMPHKSRRHFWHCELANPPVQKFGPPPEALLTSAHPLAPSGAVQARPRSGAGASQAPWVHVPPQHTASEVRAAPGAAHAARLPPWQ